MKRLNRTMGGLVVLLLAMGLALTGCATTTKVPWNFSNAAATQLEGEWTRNNNVERFRGNRYELDGFVSQRGYFRILDGNLEILITRQHMRSATDDILSAYGPISGISASSWKNLEYNERSAPTYIYSFQIEDDVLTLTLIGGKSAPKSVIGSKSTYTRVK